MLIYVDELPQEIDSCRQDIKDIVSLDLPGAESQIRRWANNFVYVDADLKQGVAPLIRTKQLDSAIRKSFVILKSRLCKKFALDETMDGQAMVNAIFGNKSEFF